MKKVIATIAIALAAIAAWTLVVFLWFPADREGREVHRHLLQVHRCAREYLFGEKPYESGSAIRDEWPRSLEQLGPSGTACLDDYLSTGTGNGWHIGFAPILDSTGRSVGYELRTDPGGVFRKSKLRHYSAVYPQYGPFGSSFARPFSWDALIHVRRDGRPASNTDPVIGSPLPALGVFANCVRTNQPGHTFHPTLDSAVQRCLGAQFNVEFVGDSVTPARGRVAGDDFDYSFSYSPNWHPSWDLEECPPSARPEEGDGCIRAILDYSLEARPTRYGETGLRSYIVFQGSMVNADPFNPKVMYIRSDVPDCEIWPGTPCGPRPAGVWRRLTDTLGAATRVP